MKVTTHVEPSDFSLVLGGPLHQLYLRTRLARAPIELLHRRIIAFILITWAPLWLLTAIDGHALSGVKVPFLQDLDGHARFLVSLPLLIFAELFVHQRIRVIVRQFINRGLIAPEELPQLAVFSFSPPTLVFPVADLVSISLASVEDPAPAERAPSRPGGGLGFSRQQRICVCAGAARTNHSALRVHHESHLARGSGVARFRTRDRRHCCFPFDPRPVATDLFHCAIGSSPARRLEGVRRFGQLLCGGLPAKVGGRRCAGA